MSKCRTFHNFALLNIQFTIIGFVKRLITYCKFGLGICFIVMMISAMASLSIHATNTIPNNITLGHTLESSDDSNEELWKITNENSNAVKVETADSTLPTSINAVAKKYSMRANAKLDIFKSAHNNLFRVLSIHKPGHFHFITTKFSQVKDYYVYLLRRLLI